jgi:hypothetical protein
LIAITSSFADVINLFATGLIVNAYI